MVLGLAVALSALWMTVFYARHPGNGDLAYLFRLAFGSGMAASIVLGFAAIRRGDVARHRAWMTRAYALALGAGTQVFTQGIGEAVLGTGELTTDLMLGAGWVDQPRGRRVRHPPAGRQPRGRQNGGGLMVRSRTRYRLRVDGHLDDHWSARFGGLTLTRESDGTTSLSGPVSDQAELHGLLTKIRDLGVTLISVAVIDPSA